MKEIYRIFQVLLLCLCCFSAVEAQQVGALQEYQQARTYVSGKHWREALPFLERALKVDPGYADALYMKAICHMSLEEYDKAVPLLKRLTGLRPDFVNGWGLLSQCYVQLKQLDNAKKAIGELSKAPGGGPESRYMSGVLSWIQGDLDKAESEWREAVRLKPEMAKAHYNLGMLYRLRGDRVRASSFLNDAVRHNPDNHAYRLGLGILQYEMGHKLNGSANLDKVRAQMERTDLASLALAYQMYVNKRYDAAEKAAARAYGENNELSEAYLLRGQCLWELKQLEEAQKMFRRALELDRNTIEAQRALDKIAAEKAAAEAKAKAEAEAARQTEAEQNSDSSGGSAVEKHTEESVTP
ncbi:MAG: tetratricopeptide repeat protein [Candidatus Bruticola sp.]